MPTRLCLLLLSSLAAAPAWADCGLKLDDAHIVQPPPNASVLAGYATINNPGDIPVLVSGASSADFVSIDFHKTMEMSGMMHMMHEPSMTIPPHGALSLVPGDFHMMLSGPKRSLKAGDTVSLSLQCGADSQAVSFTVKAQ